MQKHHRPFIVTTTVSGQTKSVEFEFDTDVTKILGFQLDSDLMDRLYFRGGLRLELNGKEIIPFGTKGYPAKGLTANQGVSTLERWNKWIFGKDGIDVGNREIKIKFQDTNHPSAGFTAYDTNLLFLVEIGETGETSA